jgi:hypothetical protein
LLSGDMKVPMGKLFRRVYHAGLAAICSPIVTAPSLQCAASRRTAKVLTQSLNDKSARLGAEWPFFERQPAPAFV